MVPIWIAISLLYHWLCSGEESRQQKRGAAHFNTATPIQWIPWWLKIKHPCPFVTPLIIIKHLSLSTFHCFYLFIVYSYWKVSFLRLVTKSFQASWTQVLARVPLICLVIWVISECLQEGKCAVSISDLLWWVTDVIECDVSCKTEKRPAMKKMPLHSPMCTDTGGNHLDPLLLK